jgi:hypothetical protein
MTFDEALAQIEVTVHGAALEELVARFRSGAISKERFVAEMASLRAAFEKTVQELTRESRALVALGLAQGHGIRGKELTVARSRPAGSSMPAAHLR